MNGRLGLLLNFHAIGGCCVRPSHLEFYFIIVLGDPWLDGLKLVCAGQVVFIPKTVIGISQLSGLTKEIIYLWVKNTPSAELYIFE